MTSKKGLSVFAVAFMTVSTIMGAGFASGREIWQFFGVFGSDGYKGAILSGLIFIFVTYMTVTITKYINTNDIGMVVMPGNNKVLKKLTGHFMALILYTVLVMMSAACGAFFYQQYGLPRFIGGLTLVILVIITVTGGFQRISGILKYIVPLLIITVVAVSCYILITPLKETSFKMTVVTSPLAPNYYIAAVLYVCLVILAAIPIMATATLYAKNHKTALRGTTLGAVIFTLLILLMIYIIQMDPEFSQAMDMPMPGYAKRTSNLANTLYGLPLLLAIYGSATTNYYAVTTRFKEGPYKKLVTVLVALSAFGAGLFGFTNVVKYMLPVEGALGVIIFIMLLIHFIGIKGERAS